MIKPHIVNSESSLFDHASPALMKVLKTHGMFPFINALHAIVLIEEHNLARPNIVYYDRKELLFGWRTGALHMFHDAQIYVQAFNKEANTFIQYHNMPAAIEACHRLLR